MRRAATVPRQQTRLTREGAGFVASLAVIAVLAAQTGNNLLYILVSVGVSLLVVAEVVGRWNLRGLEVRREMPDDLVAQRDARGSWLVRNPRRLGACFALSVAEVAASEVSGRVVMVPAGQESRVPGRWRFEQRGAVSLAEVRLSSGFPFGFATRSMVLRLPVELVVLPRPRRAGAQAGDQEGVDADSGSQTALGAFGDLAKIRPYVHGDAPSSIHWPTSARRGVPLVVERTGEGARRVFVRVGEAQGRAWEAEIGRAAGAVDRAFREGRAVGLALPDEVMPARMGADWRRTLLEALARLPERP